MLTPEELQRIHAAPMLRLLLLPCWSWRWKRASRGGRASRALEVRGAVRWLSYRFLCLLADGSWLRMQVRGGATVSRRMTGS